ncbi:MAG TPA: HAMP domain-containing sensor histidine kinase [Vicinamibacterales bacterium]|nr:HAMP domain-containing sensor histidine kinase [Vicinamibacterales bacterium]
MTRLFNARGLPIAMISGIGVSLIFLGWFGVRTVREWRRSSLLLDRQRADQAADLLTTALTRDMRAVQTSVLARDASALSLDEPYDLSDLVASAFARYPYPESFFVQSRSDAAHVVFLARSTRLPAWASAESGVERFPVTALAPPPFSMQIMTRVQSAAHRRQSFAVFELPIAGTTYQIVARLSYRDQFREELDGIFGFMVDLQWVRQHYFQDVAGQVARIGKTRDGVILSVLDDRGVVVASTDRPASGMAVSRTFPMMFFDPSLVALDTTNAVPRRPWAVEAQLNDDAIAGSSVSAINRTLLIAGIALVMLTVSLALTARATRASIRLTAMRSEFVSTVTHELKTPIATIRAAGETLLSGRLSGREALRDYGQLVVQESKRLTRLVNNMLAYARIADITDAYEFRPVEVSAIVDEVLNEFRHQLSGGAFDVEIDMPASLPPVRADRTAVVLMLNNLVDNAIRYSDAAHVLGIRGSESGRCVAIAVRDRGVGIPAEDIPRVMRRFVRGRGAASSGSGLGLSIARRIATDHGGTLSVASTVGVGTTVTVTLPIAEHSA